MKIIQNTTLRTVAAGRLFALLALTSAATLSGADDPRPVVDDSKTIAQTAAQPGLPSLYVAGDSTARSEAPLRGWGSEIGAYFDPAKINVINRAIGGRSSRTFITEGRWDKLLAELKPGDFVLVQFGHNDNGDYKDPKAKGRPSIRGEGEETDEAIKGDLKTTETIHSFGWYLRKFATDAKARGATPILLSMVPHKIWQDGKISRAEQGTFVKWTQNAATATGARYIDANTIIAEGFERLGQEQVNPLFGDARTHASPAGARYNAAAVIAGMKAWNPNPLASYFSKLAGELPPTLLASATPMPDAPAPPPPPELLTPRPAAPPRLNGPKVFGVRPGSPFLHAIPATGERPMTFSAEGLPDGLQLDPASGRITGALKTPGEFNVTLRAKNSLGTAEKPFRIVVGEDLALTPPMGWNSWNCWAGAVDQEKVLRSARALVASGLAQHGWTYINIDDTWQGQRGGKFNAIQPNEKFADMKALCDDLHALGLKAGIYSTPWVTSYGRHIGGSAENPEGMWPPKTNNAPRNKKMLPYAVANYSFATNDAAQWAEWGFDYLKYDWNPIERPQVVEMADALRATKRDILLSLSNNSRDRLRDRIAGIAPLAQAWRTTGDINDSWGSLSGIGFQQDDWAQFSRPGHWNDPDMLVVGWVGWGPKLHATKLTPDEQYTHISLWCLLAAPLLIGCDLERLDDFTRSLLTNDEVLEIDQDTLGKQATSAGGEGELKVYAKPLDDGSIVVGLFNTGKETATVTADWADLKLQGPQRVRDLWRQKDLGVFTGKFAAPVAPHGVVFLRIFAQK